VISIYEISHFSRILYLRIPGPWSDRLPDLAAELVGLNVNIIVTQGTPAGPAAKKATSTIPIVIATSGDAVGSGLVSNLAHWRGKMTGLSFLATDVGRNRFELLKEVAPKVSRVAFLANLANRV
jgi:putative tryptophan/tyrosine transport system substrate-binding protein